MAAMLPPDQAGMLDALGGTSHAVPHLLGWAALGCFVLVLLSMWDERRSAWARVRHIPRRREPR